MSQNSGTHLEILADIFGIHNKQINKLRGLSPRANYTDRRLLKLVPTFVDRGYHVVSVTDSYGRILSFVDRSRYFFF
jgi:hypothetical protein